MACKLRAMAFNLSDGPSNLFAMAAILIMLVSNAREMAFNLRAMASNLRATVEVLEVLSLHCLEDQLNKSHVESRIFSKPPYMGVILRAC